MATAQQLSLFKESTKRPRKPKANAEPVCGRGEFPPISPLNLAQESALWLCGQRSIEAQRGKRYVPASIRHPGKMQPDVAGAIIDTYTEPGQTIVDAMGGIGTTGVEGAERGRNVICVELVRHWANVAYANACRTAYRGAPGTMRVICGDARALPKLLNMAADVTVMSPPYGEALEARTHRTENRVERIRALVEAGVLDDSKHNTWAGRLREQDGVLRNNGLLASMAPSYDADSQRHQVDATLLSPPYGEAMPENGGHVGSEWGCCKQMHSMAGGYPQADALITSPAYADIRQDGGAHQFGEGSAMESYTGEARIKRRRDSTNIGNLKYGSISKALALVDRLKAGETIPEAEWPGMQYLESMALIYWQCRQVLKASGLAILVLKDYRRNKRRVRLVSDTETLMEAVGFVLHDKALAVVSKVEKGVVISKVSPFVRVNARKPEKNGGPVLLPAGEEVLVFRKEVEPRAKSPRRRDPNRPAPAPVP